MKITVIMLGLLGDVLMRTPLLRELKRAFPESQLICIVDPIGEQVLRLSPDVDGLVVTSRSKKNKLGYVFEKLKLHLNMRSRKHDLIIDLYGGKSSRRLVNASSAKQKLVLHSGTIETKGLAKERVLKFLNPYHMSNVQLQALAYLPPIPSYSFSTKPHIEVNRALLAVDEIGYLDGLLIGQKHFLISMGSSDPEKIIGLDKAAKLCRFVAEAYNLVPVVLCNPGQAFIQQTISDRLDAFAVKHIKLAPVSIPAIAYLMKRVGFVMVPDTGLFHLAIGVGVPILGIFSHTNPELVRPCSGKYEICFQQDSQKGMSVEGLPYGTRELSNGYLQTTATKLIDRLKLPV